MAKVYFRARQTLRFEGEHYIIEQQCSDGVWLLRHRRTERALELSSEAMLTAYYDGKLVLDAPEIRNISGKLKPRSKLLTKSVVTKIDEAAKRRLLYVKAVEGVSYSQVPMEAAIDAAWQSMSPRPATKPHWTSVFRWARAYCQSDECAMALVANNEGKGNRLPRFAREVYDVCDDVIDGVYLTKERPCLQHAVNIACGRVKELNALRPKSSQLKKPSVALFKGLLKLIPAFDRCVARYGAEYARKKFRSVKGHHNANFPLQRAEMDHTRMDLFVVDDETGLPLGRPWLTVLLDSFSRVVLGYCISFEPPSRATVARCLKHAFMPKVGLRELYPDLKNDWVGFGIVSEIAFDGGPEFHSDDLSNICFELGIEQHFSPRKTPWYKGKVERFQGTFNRGVTVTVPGKTFEGIVDREDYDPLKHAVITLSVLEHIVVRWIVDVYSQKPHRALECSPERKWTSNIKLHDIPVMDDPLRFDAILGGVDQRKLTHKGIEYGGLWYNSDEMTELRHFLGDVLDVEIRINRSNIGSIIVLHPEKGTPYRVPCLRKDYAEGLTEWQHEVCKKYARNHDKDYDVDGWLISLLEIQAIVESTVGTRKRKGAARERDARWKENKVASAKAAAAKASAPTPTPETTRPTSEVALVDATPVPDMNFEPVIEDRGELIPA